MTLTSNAIYSKCLLWSIIGGAFVAVVFWFIANIGGFFNGHGYAFLSGLLYASMVGEYLGAGLVGWRIVDKYFNHHMKKYMKKYIQIAIISMLIGIALVYTPVTLVSSIVLLWFFVAPVCVLIAYNKAIPLKKRK
jgi:hypothetical protein